MYQYYHGHLAGGTCGAALAYVIPALLHRQHASTAASATASAFASSLALALLAAALLCFGA